MKLRLAGACLLAVIALSSGCSSGIDGRPVAEPGAASPTEPTFPTTRPTRSTSPTTVAPQPSTPAPTVTPGVTVLRPENGYVFIETKSGKTRCQISVDKVGCESAFSNPPIVNGEPANGVEVTAGGSARFIVGNLGDPPVVTLDYGTYSAVGWTIVADADGTRFTNAASHHGLFISVTGVEIF